MNTDGTWSRRPGGRILLLGDAPSELEFENENPSPKTPPPSNALKAGDVNVASIDLPARDSLLRLGAAAKTSKAAVELLDHVKAGRIDGIRCLRSTAAMARVKRLGYDPADAIRAGEDAVVLLDPNDLRGGKPMIALRHELDPRCASAGASPPTGAALAKIDAALLKALASFKVWREGLALGRPGKCALAPLDDPGKAGLGNVLPRLIRLPYSMPAAPGTPKLVRHRHTSYKCNAADSFVSDGTPIDLLSANMRPHFISPADNLVIATDLQAKLDELLKKDEFKDLVNPSRATTLKAQNSDRLHLALVNLTGSRNLCRPGIAHFGAKFNDAGASTAKILVVYAAHQLPFDVEQIVAAYSISDKVTLENKLAEEWKVINCKPSLDLLKLTPPPPGTSGLLKVEMSDELKALLREMTANTPVSTPRASKLILKIGFEYIASLAWQSGLRHPTRGGLWFGTSYCTEQKPDPKALDCYGKSSEVTGGCWEKASRVYWKNDPLGLYGIWGSALSFATYMTLLAQGRLVDAANSANIKGLLLNACGVVRNSGVNGVIAQKCGETDTTRHDAALVQRVVRRGALTRTMHYVIAFTFKTRSKTDPLVPKLRELIRQIDKLMEERTLA